MRLTFTGIIRALKIEIGLLLLQACVAASQAPAHAVCNPALGFDWAKNEHHADPCKVATFLGGQCLGTEFSVPPLPTSPGPNGKASGFHYTPPTPSSNCTCSVAYYNLISCCARCQGGDIQSLPEFVAGCSDFSAELNSSTALEAAVGDGTVPAWAYALFPETAFNAALASMAVSTPTLLSNLLSAESTAAAASTSAGQNASNTQTSAMSTMASPVSSAPGAGPTASAQNPQASNTASSFTSAPAAWSTFSTVSVVIRGIFLCVALFSCAYVILLLSPSTVV
ncbi:hypothetical protein PsYK624_111400 [Phanerochaete sordida]|uniref:Uncharacterized protein n=1 Tax=Phanerochaete sordida TaxID=48140 RepID=A0A9P3LHG9_9APHY|nr:hypothetical protein PsYK624_111400 [Phanerochaete sordida]